MGPSPAPHFPCDPPALPPLPTQRAPEPTPGHSAPCKPTSTTIHRAPPHPGLSLPLHLLVAAARTARSTPAQTAGGAPSADSPAQSLVARSAPAAEHWYHTMVATCMHTPLPHYSSQQEAPVHPPCVAPSFYFPYHHPAPRPHLAHPPIRRLTPPPAPPSQPSAVVRTPCLCWLPGSPLTEMTTASEVPTQHLEAARYGMLVAWGLGLKELAACMASLYRSSSAQCTPSGGFHVAS